MKKKKDIKFIVLLCANIVFFISCLITLIFKGNDFFDYLHIEFILQCAFTLCSVAVYYLIDVAQSLKKLVNLKEQQSSNPSDTKKTEA